MTACNVTRQQQIAHLSPDGVSGDPGEEAGDGDDRDHGDHVDRRVGDLVNHLLNINQSIIINRVAKLS